MMKSNRQTLREVLKYIGRYRWLTLLSFVMSAAIVALTLAIPYLAGCAIDQITAEGVHFDRLARILTMAVACLAALSLTQWLMNVLNNRITYQVVHDLRESALKKIGVLPLSWLDSHPHGEIVSRVITDADQFADGLLMGFTQLFTGVLTILGTLVVMLVRQPLIALVVVLVTPASLLTARFIARRTHQMFVDQSKTRGEMTAYIDEMIGNARVVKAYGREKASLEEFDSINQRLEKCSLRATFFSSMVNPSTRFVNAIVYALVALTGGLSVLHGGMTVGMLTSFLSYANQYTKPFNEISGVVAELQNAIACAQRLLDLIHEEPEVPEPSGAVELKDVQGEVECEDVHFSYVPEKKLIEHFNLSVHAGQRVAIVGPTGSGKSTVINLLMRFYDPDQGSIRVEGHDLRNVTRRSLRRSYGMVLQETWLKEGTIRENIAFGKPDATDEEIVAAAKAAHADSFIRRLSDGYDTVLTEDGGLLSQGQKQLLCIARVMLRLPPMLILDEATSSIDTRTEQRIQSAFAQMMHGRTSFIVAHRLSTIRSADVILVMRDGKIVEQGDHESLLRQNGFYAQLYNAV